MTSWLLLLGSNRNGEAHVREAVLKLVALGAVRALTPIRAFVADGDGQGEFHNTLVQIDQAPDRQTLEPLLKSIEDAMGRDRTDANAVVIDIDILASGDGHSWQPDRHALNKGEFRRASVQALLAQAEIDIELPKQHG
ncbi:MAG: 2-amino-4-hydroxy-6-hydroxymethyldihydropteridine diphosphokinase [Rhodanobacteraceae bacterium]